MTATGKKNDRKGQVHAVMTFLSNFPKIGSIKKRNFSYKVTNSIKCYILSNRE